MSDTATITPEERAEWRKRVERLRKELRSAYADGNNRVDALTEENARLRAERDWLANKLIDCPPGFTNCAVDCAECRIEAARRAVGGEGE